MVRALLVLYRRGYRRRPGRRRPRPGPTAWAPPRRRAGHARGLPHGGGGDAVVALVGGAAGRGRQRHLRPSGVDFYVAFGVIGTCVLAIVLRDVGPVGGPVSVASPAPTATLRWRRPRRRPTLRRAAPGPGAVARAERIWRRTNRRHAAVRPDLGSDEAQEGEVGPTAASTAAPVGRSSGGGDQGDTGEHGRQDEPVEPGGPRRRGGRDGLLAVGRVPERRGRVLRRAVPDEITAAPVRHDARLLARRCGLRFRETTATIRAAQRGTPARSRTEPTITPKARACSMPGVGRVVPRRCRTGTSPREPMVAIGRRSRAGSSVLSGAQRADSVGPRPRRVTEVEAASRRPGCARLRTQAPCPVAAERTGHQGAPSPAPHMPEIWLMAERARAPEAVRPVPRARVRPAVRAGRVPAAVRR